MRPLFKGASYSFIPYKGAPFIQGRPLIKGAHYLRLYGKYSEVSNSGTCTPIYFWVQIAQKPANSCNFM